MPLKKLPITIELFFINFFTFIKNQWANWKAGDTIR